MNRSTKKYKALKLLAEGKTQSWIVRHKGYDPAVLCRYVREFLDRDWLKINIEHVSPKTYRATPKAPFKSTGGKGQVLHWGEHTRLHHTKYKMDILTEMKRRITWDKKVRLKNKVFKYYLYFPAITIEYIPTKEQFGTIVVYPHERYLNDAETDKHAEVIRNDIRITRAWMQKVLLCRLSYPVEIQDKHLARPIMNPELMRVLEKTGVMRIGDCWIDASKMGFEFGEIESTDPEKLRAMEMLQWADNNIPIRVAQIEATVSELDRSILSLNSKIDLLVNKIDDLSKQPRPADMDDFINRGIY